MIVNKHLVEVLRDEAHLLKKGSTRAVCRLIDMVIVGTAMADGPDLPYRERNEVLKLTRDFLIKAKVSKARIELFITAIEMGCDLPLGLGGAFPEDEDELP
jgi:hypothetical protein